MTTEITITIKIDKKFLDATRNQHTLASDLSDDEIIEHMQDFAEELSDPNRFQYVLDNLDYFNY